MGAAAKSYGDIENVDTTGASWETAKGDNLKYNGVKASERMAKTDLPYMDNYKEDIETVAEDLGIDGAVIAGIISRESRAGTGLDDGWGDYGNAFGLMQVDKRWHKLEGEWDSVEHLTQATNILIYMINAIGDKFPDWTAEQQLKGGLAAYNMGVDSVKSYNKVDAKTTHGDYSNDVVARAQYFKLHGY
ncbi:lysozyme g isoform X2 [Microcaecilia unicolor]|uniref:Lysozyme g n=1 Tax=Microcaecilia unicolor TaxID=1415580 RepID=A0A6P7XPJ4_9AMPH|nr:lysozyme g-like isoform X2 [Microcaecilia unicolor]